MAEMGADFRLLGEVTARAGDRVLDVGHARQRCVLAALLVDVNRVVPVDVLLDRVWAGRPPRHARNALSGYVSRLRQVLAVGGEVHLARRSGGYRLSADPLAVDLHRFTHLVRLAGRSSTEDDSLALLQRAIGLWQGSAFGSLDTPWLTTVRDTLEADRLAAELDRNDVALRLGRHQALLGELSARAAAHPLDERLAGQLMLARYRCGQQAAALHHYEQIRLSLKEELGADPSPPLRELHQRMLTADLTLAPGVPPPRQLPRPPGSFTGRDRELGLLTAISTGTGPTLAVVSGPAGVGKTALALRWAHRAAERFADGQLYVNLRGFDPSGSVLGPHEAVRGFLHALDVAPDRVPATVAEATALYRSLLAGRRMLVLLDNARDVEQVRPLLPGEPACAVVVTSRNRLTGLLAAEDGHPVEVGLLSRTEASDLLADRLGSGRLAAELAAVDEIVTRCAGLPLALAIIAARATTHPDFPLGVLAEELRDSLAALTGPDPRTDLRAVLSCSYKALSPAAANLFPFLGLHVGPEVTTAAAASLAGLAVAEVRPLLTELGDAHLTTEHVPGRHILHDLVFAYAIELAQRTGMGRRPATGRVLDHYLHTAHLGGRLLHPTRWQVNVTPARPGVTLEDLGDRAAAMKWFTAEHATLLAAVQLAAGTGLDSHTVQLTSALSTYLQRRARWGDWAAVQRVAVAAAANLADRSALAEAHRNLAYAEGELGRFDEARAHLTQAFALFDVLGDRDGQARTHLAAGWALNRQLRATEALDHCRTARFLFTDTGNRVGLARTLNATGWSHAQLGNPHAIGYCRQAVTAHRETGDPYGEAASWDSLGYAHHRLGDHAQALTGYHRALALHRAGDDHGDQAAVLDHIGDTYSAAGNHAQAQQTWQEALTILTELDIPEAEDVRAKLLR
jgi:DNA-binding SARP family transcriptional activator/tetratricopeptide (TPR) repeat protein